MTLEQRISALEMWGNAISAMLDELESNDGESGNQLDTILRRARDKNQWFVKENSIKALRSITKMLEKGVLAPWMDQYRSDFKPEQPARRVGVIMAGNIPAVGFHDCLCVLISGHHLIARCASDDALIIPFLLDVLTKIEPRFNDRITIVERLEGMEAVIATGSNNSARYFDYYFSKYPHIIRKNRNSLAVLTGEETHEELIALGEDIFAYFGLGCRNVSHLFVPEGYNFNPFFEAMEKYSALLNHNKYMNNYDYHRSLFLLELIPFLTNNFLIVRENDGLATPVSVLHYRYYADRTFVEKQIEEAADLIQCRVGAGGIPFGTTQSPGVSDYADNVDTMKFLLSL
jgi:hypothetical protein